MAGRRKFTDELEEDDDESDEESGESESSSGEGEETEERVQFTQRMPEWLEERVQEYCDDYGGMARNTAVNLLVEDALEEKGY